MKKPKYKNLKFKTMEKFDEWLKKTATKKINLKDCGQDFLAFWIDNRGEILHTTPYQSEIWNGRMIKMDSIKVGKKINFSDGLELKYPVIDIEEAKV